MRACRCWRRDFEQGAVGGVLDQRVLEGVGRHRAACRGGRPARPRPAGRARRRSSASGRSATAASRAWGNSRPSAAPICAISLTGGETIEAGEQRVVQRRGYRERRQRASQLVVVAGVREQARFQHRLGQLLDEQRHAVGLAPRSARRPRPAAVLARVTCSTMARALAPAEPGQSASALKWGWPDQGGVKSGRKVIRRSTGRRWMRSIVRSKQLLSGRVDPVHVFVGEQHRAAPRRARPADRAAPPASAASGAAASDRAAGNARRS